MKIIGVVLLTTNRQIKKAEKLNIQLMNY